MRIGRKIARVPREAMQRMMAYSWPGNVRELENVVERAVILSSGPELQVPPEMLLETKPAVATPAVAAAAAVPLEPAASVPPPATPISLEQVERSHIVTVLTQTKWRIDGPDGAARVLNMHPSTLRSRLKKLGIQRGSGASA